MLDREALRQLVSHPSLAAVLWTGDVRAGIVDALSEMHGPCVAADVVEAVCKQVVVGELRRLAAAFAALASRERTKLDAKLVLAATGNVAALVLDLADIGRGLVGKRAVRVKVASVQATVHAAMHYMCASKDVRGAYRAMVAAIRDTAAPDDSGMVIELRSSGVKLLKSCTRAYFDVGRTEMVKKAGTFETKCPARVLASDLSALVRSFSNEIGELWMATKAKEGTKRAAVGAERRRADSKKKSSKYGFMTDDDSDESELENGYRGILAPQFNMLQRLRDSEDDNDETDEDDDMQIVYDEGGMSTSSDDPEADDDLFDDDDDGEDGAAATTKRKQRKSSNVNQGTKGSRRTAEKQDLRQRARRVKGTSGDDSAIGNRTRTKTASQAESAQIAQAAGRVTRSRSAGARADIADAINSMSSGEFPDSSDEGAEDDGRRNGPSQRSPKVRKAYGRPRDVDEERDGDDVEGRSDDMDHEEDMDEDGMAGQLVRKLKSDVSRLGEDNVQDPLEDAQLQARTAKRRKLRGQSRYDPDPSARVASPIRGDTMDEEDEDDIESVAPSAVGPEMARKNRVRMKLPRDSLESPHLPGEISGRIGTSVRRDTVGANGQVVRRGRFSADEDSWLMQGMRMFGFGQWSRIVDHFWTEDFKRSGMSLKDRVRTMEIDPSQFPPPPGAPVVRGRPPYAATVDHSSSMQLSKGPGTPKSKKKSRAATEKNSEGIANDEYGQNDEDVGGREEQEEQEDPDLDEMSEGNSIPSIPDVTRTPDSNPAPKPKELASGLSKSPEVSGPPSGMSDRLRPRPRAKA